MKPQNYLKIPDFDFIPAESPTALKAGLEWLDKVVVKAAKPYVTAGSFQSLGNWALLKADGTIPRDGIYTDQACHYYLSYYGDYTKCVAVAMYCVGPTEDSEDYPGWAYWFDWLCTKSFVAEFLLGYNNKGIVVDARIPGWLMHLIAMFSRVPRLYMSVAFTRFKKLCEAGTPSELAYLLTLHISDVSDDSVWMWSTNHRPFNHIFGLESVKAFMNGRVEKSLRSDELYSDGERSSLCGHVFNRPYCVDFVNELINDKDVGKALAEYRKVNSGGKEYHPPNPFKRDLVNREPKVGQATLTEVYECIIPAALKKGLFNDSTDS